MRLTKKQNHYRNLLRTNSLLLYRLEDQLTYESKLLNRLAGSIKRSTQPNTQTKIHLKLIDYASHAGHKIRPFSSKTATLSQIAILHKQNKYLKFQSLNQATIHICVIFEQFIRTIILEYYKDDVRRLISNKETLKNSELVRIIQNEESIHFNLAEKVVESIMYGSIESWYRHLDSLQFDVRLADDLHELFLIRNCLVHNDGKVSRDLQQNFPKKYSIRQQVRLTNDDHKRFLNITKSSITNLFEEFDRKFPISGGRWIDL